MDISMYTICIIQSASHFGGPPLGAPLKAGGIMTNVDFDLTTNYLYQNSTAQLLGFLDLQGKKIHLI